MKWIYWPEIFCGISLFINQFFHFPILLRSYNIRGSHSHHVVHIIYFEFRACGPWESCVLGGHVLSISSSGTRIAYQHIRRTRLLCGICDRPYVRLSAIRNGCHAPSPARDRSSRLAEEPVSSSRLGDTRSLGSTTYGPDRLLMQVSR